MANSAIVLSGQGAQQPGMGKDLADTFDECKEIFNRADDILGYSLSEICFNGPDEELTKSQHCQPGIFVASVACYRALMRHLPDLRFSHSAGLSLGEWTALHIAGAIRFEDALLALAARGRFMQEACEATDGGMVSVIGLSLEQLDDIREKAGVQIANLNSREQTVLSGERAGIARAEELAIEAGAKKTIVLNVAGAFHSRLMAPAAERMGEVLADIEIRQPQIPVISNVSAEPHSDPETTRRLLQEQITQPVQWLQSVDYMASQEVDAYVECGPGRILSGLIRRTQKDAQLSNVQDKASLEKTLASLGTPQHKEEQWEHSMEK